MKIYHVVIVCGLLIVGGLIFWYFNRGWEIKNYPSTSTGSVIMFGDSLVEGVGASTGQTLPDQLGRLLKVPVLNYGVSGDTTRDGLMRLDGALAEHPRVVLILLGGNDFLKKIPREETFANLETIVKAFQGEGAVTVVLGVRSGIVGGGVDDEYEALAKKTGAVYVSDILSGVFGYPDLMSDAIHPNDRGYGEIAKRLTPLLTPYLH